jgi:hypothetical protein
MSLAGPAAARALAQRTAAAARQAVAQAEARLAAAEAELLTAEETGVGLEAAFAEVTAAEAALMAAEAALVAALEAAAEAAAALIAAGAALEVGMLIGQALDYGISALWDPVQPLSFLDSRGQFTSVNDLEIDTFIRSKPFELAPRFASTVDTRFPQLGTILLSFVRSGIRTFVDAAQGNAAGIARDAAQFAAARFALGKDLREYSATHSELADCLDYYRVVQRRLPSVTWASVQRMIDLASIKQLPHLVEREGMMIQQLFSLARVRCQVDIRDDLYAWIARGMGSAEAKAFTDAKYQTLSVPEVLRLHGRTLLSIELSTSPLVV